MTQNTHFERREVLFGVSIHELKTHLTAIIAAAELLSTDLSSNFNESEKKLLSAIIRNAKNIDSKLSDLFKSNLYVDRVTRETESYEISSIIKEIISELSPLINAKKQHVSFVDANGLPPVKMNKQYIQFILRTIIHNASKFTPPEGEIRVVSNQDNDHVVIEIADTGIGVPDNVPEDIFKRPSKLISNYNENNKGSGNGLAMAKYLMELHGGKIWYKSEVGKGTSFFAAFPCNP